MGVVVISPFSLLSLNNWEAVKVITPGILPYLVLKLDIKLGQTAKLDKKNKATLKKVDNDVMSASSDVIDFLLSMAILKQSANQNPETWSVFTFSLIVTFYLTKTENVTKNF